ncbi:hypothetical protein [Rhizobium leguminosarum]|uniref:hypothetical protein n=1 Tax=Rhizobium leguminosarum TaxID=384 RepID=UPI0002F66AA1|nr:hypothetical protein [Rhizobium leguminosarum]
MLEAIRHHVEAIRIAGICRDPTFAIVPISKDCCHERQRRTVGDVSTASGTFAVATIAFFPHLCLLKSDRSPDFVIATNKPQQMPGRAVIRSRARRDRSRIIASSKIGY